MIHQYFKILSFVSLILVFANSPAQIIREIENGEHDDHAKDEDWQFHVQYDSTIPNLENAKWEAFAEAQNNLFKYDDDVPVANWKNCGPINQGGRMISHAFDPQDPDILWAGSATGGVWRTSDGGDSWTAMSDGIPTMAVGAIAIDPDDKNIILIGTGEGYLLASGFLYGVGILRSVDGGATWNATGLAFNDSLQFASLAIVFDPNETNKVFAATTYGIYNSIDTGKTWSLSLPGTATALVIDPQQTNILFAALQQYDGNSGGIYRSSDNGETWQLLNNGLPSTSSYGFTSLAISNNYADILFAGISKPYPITGYGTLQGIYKSSDGGDTWHVLPDTIDFYCYPAPYDDICQGWYDNTITISPIDTNKIFIGGIYLYRSDDGGAHWKYSDFVPGQEQWMHPDHHSFAFDPDDPNRIFAFNDGGAYRSLNGGINWKQINNGLVSTQFYFIASAQTDKNLVMGGTQDNGVWYNHDHVNEFNWKQYTYGDGFQCAIDHSNANIMYATELFQGRMKSTDGGETFTEINNGINEDNFFIIPLVMHPDDPQILFTATNSKIYRTTDGGNSWDEMDNISYILRFCFDAVNHNIIYACSDPYFENSRLYISTDLGVTWESVNEPGNKISDIACDPFAAGTIYACRARFTAAQQIFKSTDFGETWINISGDFPMIPANAIAIDPHNPQHIYAGTNIGVMMSADGGAHWIPFNDGLPNVMIYDIEYFAPDSTIRVGTYGRGYWETKDPFLINSNTSDEFSIQVYPNPSDGEIQIELNMSTACDVELYITDQLGQKINSLINENLSAGIHDIIWNGKNAAGNHVAAGIYFIRFNYCGKGKSVKALIK